MSAYASFLGIETKQKFQFFDLTEKIKEIVEKSGIQNGIINIISLHTTTAILLNENEPLLLEDFIAAAKSNLPKQKYFHHDNIRLRRQMRPTLPKDECKNADSHCLSIFLPNFQTLNIRNGRLIIGKWQNILFWELAQPKKRGISIMILGE